MLSVSFLSLETILFLFSKCFFQAHARKRRFIDGPLRSKETRTIRSQSFDEHNYAGTNFFLSFLKIVSRLWIVIDDLTKKKRLKHSSTLLISATKTLQPSLHVSTSWRILCQAHWHGHGCSHRSWRISVLRKIRIAGSNFAQAERIRTQSFDVLSNDTMYDHYRRLFQF